MLRVRRQNSHSSHLNTIVTAFSPSPPVFYSARWTPSICIITQKNRLWGRGGRRSRRTVCRAMCIMDGCVCVFVWLVLLGVFFSILTQPSTLKEKHYWRLNRRSTLFSRREALASLRALSACGCLHYKNYLNWMGLTKWLDAPWGEWNRSWTEEEENNLQSF